MGTLSAEKDNVYVYAVDVEAEDLNGELSISAPGTGSLASGEQTLAFTNSFGTQTVSEDTAGSKLSGSIGITAEAVAAAAAGNYTGTTTFSITYAAN